MSPAAVLEYVSYMMADKKITKEFMTIINIIKGVLKYNKWIHPKADIKVDLKATTAQYNEILDKVAETFSKDRSKMKDLNTPADLETFVLKKTK